MKRFILIFTFFLYTSFVFPELPKIKIKLDADAWASSYFCETIRGNEVCYASDLVLDGNINTCWVEGTDSYGIGESIIIIVNSAVDSLEIVNGFARSPALFEMNSRVKILELSFVVAFTAPAQVTERNIWTYYAVYFPLNEIILEDSFEPQIIDLSISVEDYDEMIMDALYIFRNEYLHLIGTMEYDLGITRERILANNIEDYKEDVFKEFGIAGICLKIKDVYRGNEYSDTCISEVRIINY